MPERQPRALALAGDFPAPRQFRQRRLPQVDAWLKKQGKPAVMEAALAKLYLSEAYVQSSMDAIRIHGGYGYMTEFQVERELRDAVGGTLYSGTSDIQRNIIARLLGL